MPQDENFFDVLEIRQDAGFDAIEQAYRKAKKQFEGDRSRLDRVEQAYQTLINPFKRSAYLQKLNKNQPQPASSQQKVETPITPTPSSGSGRRKTQVSGVPAAGGGESRTPASGGRSKTQISGTPVSSGRTPEPKPQTPSGTSSRTPEPTPKPPSGNKPVPGGRSKTQISGGTGSASKVEPGGSKPPSSGRTKTQISGSPVPSERTSEPQTPTATPVPPKNAPTPEPGQPKPGKRTHTAVLPPKPKPQPPVPPTQALPKNEKTDVGVPGSPPVVEKPREPRRPTDPQESVGTDDTTAYRSIQLKWQIEITFQDFSRVYEINEGENLVGRLPKDGPAPAISIPDPERFISRTHASIILREGILYLEDKNSANGTFLNGQKIEPNKLYPLSEKDKITIEGRELRLRQVRGI